MSEKIKTKLDKDKSDALILSICLSVSFVAGIPLIVVGAVNEIWVVLGLAIACVVVGFYGTPIAWMHYGSMVAIKRVVDAVLIEKIETVSEISKQLQISPKVAKDRVTTAIKRQYIMGYRFDGETLVENEPKKKEKLKPVENHCPNCGGKMESFDGFDFCPYCNTRFKVER